jgi:hypothetical protein
MLLERIDSAEPEQLRPLLDGVFPFIGIPQLRPIAVALLSRLHPLPKANLKSLANSGDVFWEVPLSVQRQVLFPFNGCSLSRSSLRLSRYNLMHACMESILL